MTKYQKRCLILCKDYKISYLDKGPSFGWTFVEDRNGQKLIKPRGVCGKDYFHHICLIKSILGKPYTMGVLLHEVGHILYKHMEADMKKDFEEVVDIAYRVGYTDKMIQTLQLQFGMFENICMDLEVNSKILTVGDVIKINQYIKEAYGKGQICIPSNYKCDVRDKYKDYYEPVLEYMYNQYKNQSRNLDQLMQDMLDYIGQDMRPHQENKEGSQMDLPSETPNKEVPKEALDQPDDGEDQEDAPKLEENGEANCKYKHKGKKNSNGGASEIDESNRGAGDANSDEKKEDDTEREGGSESDKEETVKDEVKREIGEDLPDEDQSNKEDGEGGDNCYRPDAAGG